jgi:hypothetical protein
MLYETGGILNLFELWSAGLWGRAVSEAVTTSSEDTAVHIFCTSRNLYRPACTEILSRVDW